MNTLDTLKQDTKIKSINTHIQRNHDKGQTVVSGNNPLLLRKIQQDLLRPLNQGVKCKEIGRDLHFNVPYPRRRSQMGYLHSSAYFV